MKKNKLIDRMVYLWSEKPNHYKEVRNPPKTNLEKLLRPQDARQVQYNNWSKKFKVYSGSYLPNDHNELKSKGWKKKKASDNMHHIYQRKSTNQTVRHDDETFNKKKKAVEPAHWHWLVWWKPYYGRKTKDKMRNAKNSEKIYYNEYGEKTSANRDDHHIKKGET